MPSRARIAIASRLAVRPSRPYSRAAKSRFSIGLSFLKKAASTLTRLISRLTAISSRTMSWPKTSTRPSSRVSRPQMSRMSVDLPEPLAPRIPWMSPRSRRIDTFGDRRRPACFFRPTMNRLVTSSMRRAGTAVGSPASVGSDRRQRRLAGRSVLQFGGQEWRSRWAPGSGAVGGVGERGKPRAPIRRWSSGGPRGSGVRDRRWRGRASKKPGARSGPRLVVRPGRSCRLRSSSRWAQISRSRSAPIGRNASMEERLRHHSEPPPLESGSCPRPARRSAVYAPRRNGVNPVGRRCRNTRRMT